MYGGLDIRISIILSLYLKTLRAMPYFMAANAGPNTDVSTVEYFFECNCTKAVFTYIKKSHLDL